MPMIQDMWKKLSANERLASWGAIVVIVGWLLGLVLGTYGFGLGGGLIGGILLLGLYYLKYGSAQPPALAAPTETIALVISAITGLYALAALGTGFLLGGYFVAVVVTLIGSAMMVLGTWRD